MRQILWSSPARADLAQIIEYIAQRNPPAARRMKSLIEDALMPTLRHPFLYRAGRVVGTREIVVHPNYIVVYAASDDAVDVLRVLHSRQQYP